MNDITNNNNNYEVQWTQITKILSVHIVGLYLQTHVIPQGQAGGHFKGAVP